MGLDLSDEVALEICGSGVVFLIGFLLIGMIGTSTSMTFVWPAYACMGLAGILSIGLLFKEMTFFCLAGAL